MGRGLAGHEGPVDLATSYELCRRLNAAHGRTYYFATRFLPARKRPHVHALYGFARYADDLVDHLDLSWSPARRRAELERWTARFLTDLEAGASDEPILKAVVHTVRTLGIAHEDLAAFLRSMAMDLTVTRYETYEELSVYTYGSAAVIGSMMLPVLEPTSPAAREPAMALGVAFQLTNFLRDVAEDHTRGRIYLPLEDLARFEVDERQLAARRMTPSLRRLIAFEATRTRELYQRAEAGWALLPPTSRACIRIAHHLYAEILDRLEAQDWDVFSHRASVPPRRKTWVAARELARTSIWGRMNGGGTVRGKS
ncbi:MAG: phytoene/squalene synthase family protein [Egibacteraceae bacterium]